MYFPFFKPQTGGKRPAERRCRLIQRFPYSFFNIRKKAPSDEGAFFVYTP